MSLRRTGEWLAQYARDNAEKTKREQERRQTAREWNGNVEPVSLKTIIAGAPTRKDGQRPPAIAQSGTPAPPLYPLVTLCRSMRLAEPTPEFRFHPARKWRFDYAWPLYMLALEVDGGVWTQGRHTRGQGAIDDMEKASEAAILGWRLLYCTPDQLRNGVALDRIVRALTDREAA